MKVKDKVCLVTGGTGGLGLAFCHALAVERGARVLLTDVSASAAASAAAKLDAEARRAGHGDGDGPPRVASCGLDVTSDEACIDAFEHARRTFGAPVSVLVNNAGMVAIGNAALRKTIDVNLVGLIRCATLALAEFRDEELGGNGVILNVASVAGLGPVPNSPVYAASKHGVVGWTRSVKGIYGPGVSCSAICPSYVDTAMFQRSLVGMPEGAREATLAEVGGLLSIADVMRAALPLIDESESHDGDILYITPRSGPAGRLAFRPPKRRSKL